MRTKDAQQARPLVCVAIDAGIIFDTANNPSRSGSL